MKRIINRFRSYYNTNNESGKVLRASQDKALTQNEIILEIFKSNPKGYTPSEVHKILDNRYPITSVRRSITNLTLDAKLVKTDNMRLGGYGKLTHVWKLK